MLLATMFGMHPFLKKLFADAAYQGSGFHKGLARVLPHLETEIVRRSDQMKGFEALPKRWIVERTIAWLNRCRRLSKDWENLNRKGLAFLRLASILHSFRSMNRIEARRRKARPLRLRFSQSFASRRQRLSQAMVRSTIQRFGRTANPWTRSARLTISVSMCGSTRARVWWKARP